MKFRSVVWIALGLVLICAALLSGMYPTRAQSGESSCITCHETQAKNPVRAKGEWHIDHSTLACEVCHAGDPSAASMEAAHAEQVTDPLAAGISCSLCHPDDSSERIANYQALITPEPSPTIELPTPTEQSEGCWVVATACANTGTGGGTGLIVEPTAVVTVSIADMEATAMAPALATPIPTIIAAAPTQTVSAAAAASPNSTTPLGGASGSNGSFSWLKMLQFTRGPLFKAAFWFFIIGMLFRLVQALRAGWKHRVAIDKTGRAAGVGKSFLSGLLVLPFIPGLKGAFQRKPVVYLAGGLFHMGLLAVLLFSKTHMSAWKSQIGFGWPVLPAEWVHWLAAIGVVAMVALLINRLLDPVLRLISGPAEWLNWLLVFLPMATGFVLARKLLLPYEVSFSIHMLLVDILLIWIPLSRISHFAFYFFSRAIHGVEFNTHRVVTP
jgi:nitrate reductase gamma subunit